MGRSLADRLMVRFRVYGGWPLAALLKYRLSLNGLSSARPKWRWNCHRLRYTLPLHVVLLTEGPGTVHILRRVASWHAQ